MSKEEKITILQSIDWEEIWGNEAKEYLKEGNCIPPIHHKGCNHKFDGIEIPVINKKSVGRPRD